jgi:hypothetical protein
VDAVLIAVIVGLIVVVLTIWLSPLLTQYDPVPKKLGGTSPSTTVGS